MKRIIGIGGLAGSGKDTYAQAIRNAVLQRTTGGIGPLYPVAYRFEIIAMADPRTLRAAAAAAFQVPMEYFIRRDLKDAPVPEWGISPREMLRAVGESMRAYDPDHWVKVWGQLALRSPAKWIIVPDIRRQNEIDGIHELGGVVVCMVREGCKYDGHETEKIAYEAIGRLREGWTEVGRFLRSNKDTPFDLFCENYYQAQDEAQAIASLEPSAQELLDRIEQGRIR
jgi:hypothetical protein